eukprot:jgi/Picsp_1/2945/NSC_01170-R1_protein kinase domain-containing protein
MKFTLSRDGLVMNSTLEAFKEFRCAGSAVSIRRRRHRKVQVVATQQKPAMRTLSPGDSSDVIAAKNVDERASARIPERLVPMTYRGPPELGTSGQETGTHQSVVVVTPAMVSRSSHQDAPRSQFSRTMIIAGFDENPENDLPQDYKYTWAKDDYNKTKRTIDTWSFVLTLRARLWLLEQPWSYPGGMDDAKKGARARSLAIWIRESILQLGPTFIKLGQLFSTRSDLFPAEFVEELSKLQDRVPAFSSDKAIALIEKELGAPVEELFVSFNRKPIAAASLGQVHTATLHSGETVVVKVQRPGLKRLFDIDLENLRIIATQLDKGDDGSGARDFKGIYEECAKILYEEIDYINEGKNADKFRRNFKLQDWVKTPRVYWQRTSSAILTMEYAPGSKITDLNAIKSANLDSKIIAKQATEAYLIQILKHGFFHADPHPGNIAIDPKGNLIFYDFGMMGTIVPGTREQLLDLFYGIAQKDVDAVLVNLTDLGIIAPTSTDTIALRRALGYFVDNIGRQAQEQETVAAIGEDLFSIAVDSPFRFPATFTFVLRAFATLEGIGKALDPGFSFAQTAAPYAQELLDIQATQSQQSFILDQLTTQASEVGAAAAAMPMRVQRIEKAVRGLELGDWKPRVRVLEAERTARKAGIMQVATLQSIASMGFFNAGIQFALQDKTGPAGALLAVASVFGVSVLLQMRRVKRLDKFEDNLKGRNPFTN